MERNVTIVDEQDGGWVGLTVEDNLHVRILREPVLSLDVGKTYLMEVGVVAQTVYTTPLDERVFPGTVDQILYHTRRGRRVPYMVIIRLDKDTAGRMNYQWETITAHFREGWSDLFCKMLYSTAPMVGHQVQFQLGTYGYQRTAKNTRPITDDVQLRQMADLLLEYLRGLEVYERKYEYRDGGLLLSLQWAHDGDWRLDYVPRWKFEAEIYMTSNVRRLAEIVEADWDAHFG